MKNFIFGCLLLNGIYPEKSERLEIWHKVGWMSCLEVGIGPMDGPMLSTEVLRLPEPFASENGNSIFSPERKKP